MNGRQNETKSLQTEQIVLGGTGTIGTTLYVTAGANIANMVLKLHSGGTFSVYGTTGNAAYIFAAGEVLSFGGPADFFVQSIGATSTALLIRERNNKYSDG